MFLVSKCCDRNERIEEWEWMNCSLKLPVLYFYETSDSLRFKIHLLADFFYFEIMARQKIRAFDLWLAKKTLVHTKNGFILIVVYDTGTKSTLLQSKYPMFLYSWIFATFNQQSDQTPCLYMYVHTYSLVRINKYTSVLPQQLKYRKSSNFINKM